MIESRPPTQKEAQDLVFAWRLKCWITRNWHRYLSSAEVLIVEMVLDRTLGWQKPWEAIPYRHFTQGFFCPGQPLYSTYGTGLGAATLAASLQELRAKQVLLAKNVGRQKIAYALNLAWEPLPNHPTFHSFLSDHIKPDTTMPETPEAPFGPALRVSKHRKSQKVDANHFNSRSGLDPNHFGIRSDNNTNRKRGSTIPPGGGRLSLEEGESLDAIEEKVSAMHEGIRSTRKAKKGRVSSEEIQRTWQASFRTAFKGQVIPTWKAHELVALAKYSAAFVKGNPSVPFLTYLSWVIENWRPIGKTTFNWMGEKFPALPAPGFIIKLCQNFETAYGERQVIEARSSMTAAEARADQLRRDGFGEESVARQSKPSRKAASPQATPIETFFKRPAAKKAAAGPPALSLADLIAQGGESYE